MSLKWGHTTGGYTARTARGTWFIDDTQRPEIYHLDWFSATQPAGGVQMGRFKSLLEAKMEAQRLHDRHTLKRLRGDARRGAAPNRNSRGRFTRRAR